MYKIALAGLLLLGLAGTSSAASSSSRQLHEAMLQKQAAQQDAATTRKRRTKGRFKVHYIFQAQPGGPATKPLRCEVFASHFGAGSQFYTSSRSGPVVFTGNNGACNITLFIDWPSSNEMGTINLSIGLTSISEAPNAQTVDYSIGLDPIPVPANNFQTQLNGTLSIP